MAQDLLFHSVFIASKAGKTGLTVTVDVDKIERATGTRTAVATGASATEGRNGHYYYRSAGVTDLTTHDYVACFKTADSTVDQQNIHAAWFPFPLAYDDGGLLQAEAATVSDKTGYALTADYDDAKTAAQASDIPTAAAVADAVWDEALSGHAAAGSAGATLSSAGSAADPLLNDPSTYAVGTAGYNLNRIGRAIIEAVSPVATGGNVETIQGDDYQSPEQALEWSSASWPDLTGATVAVVLDNTVSYSGTVVTPTGTKLIRLSLTDTQTAALPVGRYSYQVIATLSNSHVVTLVEGAWVSRPRYTVPA